MTTLSTDELDRIKREVLDNVLGLGAEPYISIKALYALVRDNVSGASVAATSSSTAVTAAQVAAGGVTITVALATGLAVGVRVQLDVDGARETCLVRSISGTTVGVNCRKPHAGTYPVEIESALTLVRGCLSDLALLEDKITAAADAAGVKKVDEVEFFGPSDGRSVADELRRQQHALRLDLARMCGLTAVLAAGRARGGAGSFEIY